MNARDNWHFVIEWESGEKTTMKGFSTFAECRWRSRDFARYQNRADAERARDWYFVPVSSYAKRQRRVGVVRNLPF